MTDAFWWYLLAGFIVGFTLSTLWEWLYFRRKRMRIENRRIAELEAMLRSSILAEESQSVTATRASEPWVSPSFDDPGAYLDIEDEAAVSVVPPAELPPTLSVGVGVAQVNRRPRTPTPAPLLSPSPPADTLRSSTQTTATAVPATAAASREDLSTPAPGYAPLTPAYALPRSSTFPTVAAQVTSAPESVRQTASKGSVPLDRLPEAAAVALPSAALQPGSTRAPLSAVSAPSATRAESVPAQGTVDSGARTEKEECRPDAALATAGVVATAAATRQLATEPFQQARPAEAFPAWSGADDGLSGTTLLATARTVAASPAAPATQAQQALPDEAAPGELERDLVKSGPRANDLQASLRAEGNVEQPDRNVGKVAVMAAAAMATDGFSEKHQAGDAGQLHANSPQHKAVSGVASVVPADHTGVNDGPDAPVTNPDNQQTEPITPAKIDALVVSIHELIDTVQQRHSEDVKATTARVEAAEQLPETSAIYLLAAQGVAPATSAQDAEPSNRVEEALVLLVRSVSRFMHQLRVIVSRERAQDAPLQRRVAASDLMYIDGMKQQYIERLRVANITSSAELARLSEIELRMLLITPGDEPLPDSAALLARAAAVAAGNRTAS